MAIVCATTGEAASGVQSAIEVYQETWTFEGTIRGMGKGALKDAVEGAKTVLFPVWLVGHLPKQ